MSVECTLCWQSAVAVQRRPDGTTHNEWVHVFRFTRNTYSEYASRRISGDMQVDICFNHVLLSSGDDSQLKIAKYSRDKFEQCEVSCTLLSLHTSVLPQSVRLSFISLSSEAVPFVCILRSTMIMLWLLLLQLSMIRLILHFNMWLCTCPSNCIHILHVPKYPRTIKVWWIYEGLRSKLV